MPTATIHEQGSNDQNVIPMSQMQPGEIAEVIDSRNSGSLVMRTLSTRKFEVMDLSIFNDDECWTNMTDIKVKLLDKPITITFQN